MVRPELITYIQEQQAHQISREKITADLVTGGGWNEEDIREAFSALESPGEQDRLAPQTNPYWDARIPKANKSSMLTSLFLFFGLDLYILIIAPDLFPYWLAMLAVMLIFGAFYYYENHVLAHAFRYSESRWDSWLHTLVTQRNATFVLSLIPLIQILGMLVMLVLGIPYLIAYTLMVRARYRALVSVADTESDQSTLPRSHD